MLEAVGAVRRAEADRGVERVARAAVVAGHLVRGAEPLVDLRRLERELVLEREREPGADGLHPRLEVPALDADDAFEPQDPRPQVDPLRAPGLLRGQAGERDRVAVAAGARQVAGGDQALRGGLARDAVGGEGVRRDAACGQRALAVALQVVDRGEPALGVGERAAGALRAPRGHHLALRPARLGELARELREPRVALEHRDPLGAPLPLRPHVERLAPEPCRVAIRVHRGQLVDRPHERVERAGSVARGQPVAGDLRVTAAALLERDGQPAVERAPAQPRHVLVDRVARERVTEGGAAALELLDQAAGEQLVEARLAAQRGHELEVEAGPGDRRRLGGPARLVRQVARAQQHRVADRLRQRHVGVEGQVDARVARSQPAAGARAPRRAPRRRTGCRPCGRRACRPGARTGWRRAHDPRARPSPRR